MSFVAQRGGEILRRLPSDRLVTVAEVGVYDGRLSAFLLHGRQDLTLLMVDRWAEVPPDHRYHRTSLMGKTSAKDWRDIKQLALDATTFAGTRAQVHPGESREVAKRIPLQSVDLVFVDADHTYEGVLEDLTAWYPTVRSGGYIGGHDWDHPEEHLPHDQKQWNVRGAVEYFFLNRPAKDIEAGENRTWFVRKP